MYLPTCLLFQERHEAELEVRDRHVEALRAEVRTKDDQLENEIAAKDDQIHRLVNEIAARDDQMGGLTRQLEVSDLLAQALCEVVKKSFQVRDRHIEELQTEIQMKNDQIAAKERENVSDVQDDSTLDIK